MTPATEILIVILSVTLTIFLVVAIILGIYLIKLTSDIRKLSRSAEKTAASIESAVTGAAKLTSPIFIADMILNMINKAKKPSKKEKDDV